MVSSKSVLIFLIFILLIHTFGSIYGWYWTYRWLDIPMHFLGGFWLAMVCVYLNRRLNVNTPQFIATAISILGFVALIGVLWEFWEFICDFLILHKQVLQPGAADTIKDLFFDLVGGTAFILIFKRIFIRQDLTK
jgi:hypothetical protein